MSYRIKLTTPKSLSYVTEILRNHLDYTQANAYLIDIKDRFKGEERERKVIEIVSKVPLPEELLKELGRDRKITII